MNYRNKKILDYAREAPHCMRCHTANMGQIVAAHSNRQKHGKGFGIKAHDLPAYLCNVCHDEIDGRIKTTLTADEKNIQWADAMFETFLWLLQSGKLTVN